MKKNSTLLGLAILTLGLGTALAQFGPPPGSSPLDEALSKLMGKDTSFSATMESHVKTSATTPEMVLTGKMYVADGNSRSEMDMTKMKGGGLPAEAVEQMKSMGMGEMVAITRVDKKITYMVYPGLEAYAKMALPQSKLADTNATKIETTELGKEVVDGHPCLKKQLVVTDKSGKPSTVIVWNATDLKGCPVKMEQTSAETSATMYFKNISLDKPAASLFEPPANYKAYDNVQTMMQTEIMKRMGGGLGLPPQ